MPLGALLSGSTMYWMGMPPPSCRNTAGANPGRGDSSMMTHGPVGLDGFPLVVSPLALAKTLAALRAKALMATPDPTCTQRTGSPAKRDSGAGAGEAGIGTDGRIKVMVVPDGTIGANLAVMARTVRMDRGARKECRRARVRTSTHSPNRLTWPRLRSQPSDCPPHRRSHRDRPAP